MTTPFYAVRFEEGGNVGAGGGGDPHPHPAVGIYTNWAGVQASVKARLPGTRFTLRLFLTRPEAVAYLTDFIGPQNSQRFPPPASPAYPSFMSPSQQEQQCPPSYSGGGGAREGEEFGGQNLFDAPPEYPPPTVRAQPIKTGWLDAQLARLCPGLKLDVLQRRALEEVVIRRNNVFLTGSGGVGKSYVTTLFIQLFKEHYGAEYGKKVCVTASTGIASTQLNGTTLHTATGVGVPRCWDNFGRMFGHDKNVEHRWSKSYEVLIIDEISMLSGEMLDALSYTIQRIRHNASPFGGLQVIFIGDFAQLPPVPEDPTYTTNDFVRPEDWYFPRHHEFWHMPVITTGAGSQQQQQEEEGGGYCRMREGLNPQPRQEVLFSNRGLALQSEVWWNLDLRIIELTKVFRQDDVHFIATLNRMRKGETTHEDLHWLNQEFYYAPFQKDLTQQKELERREQEQLQIQVEQQQREEIRGEEEYEYEIEQQYLQMLESGMEEEVYTPNQTTREQSQSPISTFVAIETGGDEGAADSVTGAGTGRCEEAATRATLSKSSALHLYPKNVLVERRNKLMLDALDSPLEEYDTHDFVWHENTGAILRRGQSPNAFDGRVRRDLQLLLANHTYYKTCLAAERVELKLGAKVLLLKNLDLVGPKKLVNGSVGVVVSWAPLDDPCLDLDMEEEVTGKGKKGGNGGAGTEEQMEGLTSRKASPSPTKRRRDKEHDLIEYKEKVVNEWFEANKRRIPVVEFTNGRKKAIYPELLSENIVGVGSTCRIQLPLMIGFAISIHKSQGMTLQEALVDVQECFDGGQTYVALSRVGPRLGLRLARRLGMDSIKVNPTFLLWNRLRNAMDHRRMVLLSLLASHKGPGATMEAKRVESLGMKGLYDEAIKILRIPAKKGEELPEIRKAWAALKNSLDPLKPGRDERKKEVRILHWQCLDWWKARNNEKMRAIYRSPFAAGATERGSGGTSLGLAHS
ncbi:dna helicase aaa partial [Nannochloropsis oceanica]